MPPNQPTTSTSTGSRKCRRLPGRVRHTDVIAFTVGWANTTRWSVAMRWQVWESLGIELDERVNGSPSSDARVISADSSRVTVVVIPDKRGVGDRAGVFGRPGLAVPVHWRGVTSAVAPRLLNAIPATRARGSRAVPPDAKRPGSRLTSVSLVSAGSPVP